MCGPNAIDTLAVDRPTRETSFSAPRSSLGRYEVVRRKMDGIDGIERRDRARGRFPVKLCSSKDGARLLPAMGDDPSGRITATPEMATVQVTEPCARPIARVQ